MYARLRDNGAAASESEFEDESDGSLALSEMFRGRSSGRGPGVTEESVDFREGSRLLRGCARLDFLSIVGR